MQFNEHPTGKFYTADDADFRYSLKTWGKDHTDVIIERKEPPEVVFSGTTAELRSLHGAVDRALACCKERDARAGA